MILDEGWYPLGDLMGSLEGFDVPEVIKIDRPCAFAAVMLSPEARVTVVAAPACAEPVVWPSKILICSSWSKSSGSA